MKEDKFEAICSELLAGATFREVAEKWGYVDAESAGASVRLALTYRGKMLVTRTVHEIVDDPRAELKLARRKARRSA